MKNCKTIKRIGIVGCGAIGTTLAQFIDQDLTGSVHALFLCDIDQHKAQNVAKALRTVKAAVVSLETVTKKSDLVIECASAHVSYQVARRALMQKKSVMILSIGGIVSKSKELFRLAQQHQCALYLPSGAICGIDGIKALSMAGIDRATLTTRKPPRGLEGAPYVKQHKIDLKSLTKETVIFRGNALEAIQGFPANVNVAALLSIAGIGARKTRIVIIASPESTKNIHEITIESKAGKITTICENVPFINNPKTSYLAALSAMAVLKNIFLPIRIGN